LNEEARVEEYYGGVAKEKKKRPGAERERERESKQINKDKPRLMAVQEKV
jgi:hypothetical protein